MNILQKSIWLMAVLTLSACGAGSTQQSPGFSPGNGPTADTPPFNEKSQSIADQSAVEGYAFSVETSDAFSADSNRINRYEARNLPAGLSINAATGEITGTTGEVGIHDVIVTAIYDNGEELDTDFQLTVEENDAPTLVEPIDDMTVATGQPATIAVSDNFSDPEGGALTFSVSSLPDGMTFDAANGEISGTPTVPGDYEITVTATDEAGESVNEVFLLTVADNNAPPTVVQPIPAQTASQGYAKTIETAASFNDPENGELTYSAAGLPEGMAIDTQSGVISGTPTVPGDYDVLVTATDPGGATASSTFPLRVDPNQAPVVNPPLPDRAEQPGTMYSFDTGSNFSDPEGGALMFSATGLPQGANIDPQTGVITGIAGANDTFEITVTATDQVGASLSDSFEFVISADNQSPQNNSPIPDQTTIADQAFAFDTNAFFSDPEGEPLSYSATGLPDGLSINPQTGEIAGTPTVPGDYTIVVTATDPDGASVSDDFVLTVDPAAEGSPTLVSPIEDETATAGQPKTVTTAEHFNDPDGQPLTFSAAGLPDGMSIDSDTGEISGTPTVPGDYTVVVTATDPNGNSISDDFDLAVAPAAEGSPTLVSPIEDETATAGQPKTVTTAEHFNDPDGQPLTFTATGLPDGMSIDSDTGEISGTPTVPGDYTVVVTATDPDGNSISDDFDLAVAPAADGSPTLVSPIEDEIATAGQPKTVTTAEHFNDPDGQPLTYSATGLPEGLSINALTGEISGTPTVPGEYTVVVTAMDPNGNSVSDDFTLEVDPAVAGAPTRVSPIEDETAIAGEPKTVTTAEHFNEPDGQPLSFSATGLPEGLMIDPQTGEISGTPTTVGDYTIVVTATDPDGNSIADSFDMQVAPGNEAPQLVSPIEDESAVQGYPIAVTTAEHFTDPDGDALTYSANGLPAGLTIDPQTGEITGAAEEAAVFSIEVVATDPRGAAVSDTFILNVAVNQSPGAGPQPTPRAASAGQPYEQDTSEDFNEDPEGGTLTYSSSELPPGLIIDPQTGIITGEPSEPGQYSYSVAATDPGGASATQIYNLTIAQGIQAFDDITPTNQDTPVTIDVLANDSPLTDTRKVVSAITVQPRSGSVVIGAGGQNVVYTPFAGSVADDEFEYQISDGVGTSEATVTVFIIPGRVIYRSNVEFQNFQLYGANSGDNESPEGLTPAALPLVSNGVKARAKGYGYDVHEQSGRAVYSADQQFTDIFEIWSVNLNSALVPLTQQRLSRLPPEDDVSPLDDAPDMQISPDGSRVIYRSNAGLTFAGFNLFVVNFSAPGQPELANPTLDYLTYDGVVEADYQWLSDSSAVIFRANLEASDKRELYIADLQGSQGITKLHPPLPAGTEVKKFIVSPDGSFLVYRVNVNGENFDTLKLVDLNAPLPNATDIDVRLDNSSGSVIDDGLSFSPNGRWLLVVGSATQAIQFRPYSIDLDQLDTGLELVELSGRDVSTPLRVDSNNEWVYFMAFLNGEATQELFRAALDNPGVVEPVSADFDDDVATGVRNFIVADNAMVVAYVADHDFATQNELYAVRLDGMRQRIKLTGDDFTVASDVQNDMAFTNDSDKVIYIADPGGINRKELFVVDLDYPGITFKISESMVTVLDQVEDFYLTPVPTSP